MRNRIIENRDGSLECPIILGTKLVRREVKQLNPIEGAQFADCVRCRGLSEMNEVLCDGTFDGFCGVTGNGVVVVDKAKTENKPQ